MSNPILNYKEFPPYDQINASQFEEAVLEIIKEAKENYEKIYNLKEPRTFENTVLPIIAMDEKIGKVITPISQLFSVMATKEVREEFEKAQRHLITFSNEVSMDKRYSDLFKDYSQTAEAKALQGERKRHLDNVLKGLKLSGAFLNDEDKEKMKAINLELHKNSLAFSNNVISTTFNLELNDEADLAGLPEDIIKAAEEKAKALKDEIKEDTKWVFNLDMPSYLPFMKYSDRSDLRKILWEKTMTKATAEGIDNRPIIQEIIRLKKEKAKLLGFNTFAELSLETKMAKSPKEVMTFLDRIANDVSEIALKEKEEIKDLIKEKTGEKPAEIMPWDNAYWSNKLKEEKYSFDENTVKEYFEAENTLKGLFNICETIYGITFEKIDNIPTWHKDVTTYKIFDRDKNLRSYVYVDLFPRTSLKRSGAWMNGFVSGQRLKGKEVIPQVGVHCNFTEPVGDKPALLSYSEAQTLFHEFGHALHGALSMTELASLAGTSVKWDVVELPSQFMENFLRNKKSLSLVTKHYKTGEAMPEELMDKLIESNGFMKASFTRTQITYGMFDLTLHHTAMLDAEIPNAHEVYKETHLKYSMSPYIENTYFETAFSHIFAGGYAAGYYSYMWANILEADAFSLFEEQETVLDPKAGKLFMENILEKGDSEDMNILFERFRGRPVSDEALLKRLGIEK